jgi:hypothetical protein
MKLIGAIIAIIIVIAVVVVVVFLFMGGASRPGELVGTWTYSEPTSGMTVVYKFNGDGTLEAGTSGYTMKVGTWHTSGNQICFEASDDVPFGTSGLEDQCVDYVIDGNELIMTYLGSSITLTKS